MIRSLILISLLAVASCQQPQQQLQTADETPPVESTPLPPVVDAAAAREAVKELESWDAVIEVLHDESRVVQWEIGVKDDGTMRYGLAESVCMELIDRGLSQSRTWVRIIDRPALMSNGGDFQAASLGRVRCSDGTWMNP